MRRELDGDVSRETFLAIGIIYRICGRKAATGPSQDVANTDDDGAMYRSFAGKLTAGIFRRRPMSYAGFAGRAPRHSCRPDSGG